MSQRKSQLNISQCPGYAPFFCYPGTQEDMLGNESRPGSQHCSNGTIEFTQSCINKEEKLGLLGEELLIRADSSHDDNDYFKSRHEIGVKFLIKRNCGKNHRCCIWLLHVVAVSRCRPLMVKTFIAEHYHITNRRDTRRFRCFGGYCL